MEGGGRMERGGSDGGEMEGQGVVKEGWMGGNKGVGRE